MKLQEILGREPTDDELGEEMGMTGEKIVQLRNTACRPASLDAPVGESGFQEGIKVRGSP